MDEICEAISNKIYKESAGAYVVFYEDELLEAIPDSTTKSISELERALKTLSKLGYIDIKYARGHTFCIAGLKRCESQPLPTLSQAPESKHEHKVNVGLHLFLCALWGGLAGGFLGGLFAAIIF
jgi:hypothetical protein